MDLEKIKNEFRALSPPFASREQIIASLANTLGNGEHIEGVVPGSRQCWIATSHRLIHYLGKSNLVTIEYESIVSIRYIKQPRLLTPNRFEVRLKDGTTINEIVSPSQYVRPSVEYFEGLTGRTGKKVVKLPGRKKTENELIMPIGGRGEKLLSENLGAGEEVLVKIAGDFGQVLSVTNKRLYIIKWGFMAGQIFGGKCIAYEFRNITAIEIKKHLLNNIFMVLTPSTQDNNKLSYWGQRGDNKNAVEADYAITFQGDKEKRLFQEAANIIRDLIAKSHQHPGIVSNGGDNLDQIEKLSSLKVKGIITEEEFQAKKKQLLGL